MHQYNEVSLLLADKVHSKPGEDINYLDSKAVSWYSWHSWLFSTDIVVETEHKVLHNRLRKDCGAETLNEQ